MSGLTVVFRCDRLLEEVNMQHTKVVHPDKPETWETRGAVYKRLTRWAEDAD